MITIRAARIEDAPGIAKVHVDSWRTTYAGIVPDDYLANLSYQQRTTRWEGELRRLVRVFAEQLLQVGMKSMLLWVFARNPSRRFYEALGGKYLKAAQFEVGGVTLEEVAYGWGDVSVLLQE